MGLLSRLKLRRQKNQRPSTGTTDRAAHNAKDVSAGLTDASVGGEYVGEGTRRNEPPPPAPSRRR